MNLKAVMQIMLEGFENVLCTQLASSKAASRRLCSPVQAKPLSQNSGCALPVVVPACGLHLSLASLGEETGSTPTGTGAGRELAGWRASCAVLSHFGGGTSPKENGEVKLLVCLSSPPEMFTLCMCKGTLR